MLVHIFQLQNPQKWTLSIWNQVNKGITVYLTYYHCVSNIPVSTNLWGRKRDKGDVTRGDMALCVPALTWRWCKLQCSGYIHIYIHTWIHIHTYICSYICIYLYVSMHCTVNHWSPLLERQCKRQDVASATSPFSPDCGSPLYVKQRVKLEPNYWSRHNRFNQRTADGCIIEIFYQIPGLWVRMQCLTVSNFNNRYLCYLS